MATTKGESISRIRRSIKALNADAFITDRLIYSLILKYAKLFIKRADDANKLGRYNGIYQYFPGVELEEVSKIEADCVGIATNCTIKRTVDKLPPIIEGSFGPIIRSVLSIDGSHDVFRTYAKLYVQMTQSTSFKYNKKIYCWWKDGRLYFPNVEWDVVDIEAMWEEDISTYIECAENCCVDRRNERSNIPESLFAEIEGPVRQELLTLLNIPKESGTDNQSVLK